MAGLRPASLTGLAKAMVAVGLTLMGVNFVLWELPQLLMLAGFGLAFSGLVLLSEADRRDFLRLIDESARR